MQSGKHIDEYSRPECYMIIDHIGIAVSSVGKSTEFYSRALAPLGIEKLMEFEAWCGFGKSGKAEFWLEESSEATPPVHIAFTAENRSQVDDFYAAAIKAGAKDNGPPGIRKIYHPHYYGAFVIDMNGHNLEAVCHRPE